MASATPRISQAAAMAARVAQYEGWHYSPTELERIVRARRNGAGLRLTFRDGSGAFIPRGSVDVQVVA